MMAKIAVWPGEPDEEPDEPPDELPLDVPEDEPPDDPPDEPPEDELAELPELPELPDEPLDDDALAPDEDAPPPELDELLLVEAAPPLDELLLPPPPLPPLLVPPAVSPPVDASDDEPGLALPSPLVHALNARIHTPSAMPWLGPRHLATLLGGRGGRRAFAGRSMRVLPSASATRPSSHATPPLG
jgi:hypothetical protein